MKKVILLLSIVALFMSCIQSKEKNVDTVAASNISEVVATVSDLQQDNGYTLMKINCYACHNPNTKSHDEILAPPFRAVKMHYNRNYSSKKDFVNAMVNWVQNPEEDKAIMYGAVKRFKVMPKLELPKDDLEKIAEYIYDNDVEQPEWMEEHMQEMKGNLKTNGSKEN